MKNSNDIQQISVSDYFRLNAPFRLWLRKEKSRYFDEMTGDKARKYFSSFVKEWNSGRLQSRYYKQDADLVSLNKDVVTRHHWKFADKMDKSELEAVRNSVHKATTSGKTEDKAPAVVEHGPTMPPLLPIGSGSSWQAESSKLFSEEQRDRDRLSRKRDRRREKEREELLLDEVAPRETGREAKIAKRRNLNQARHAEKTLDNEVVDDDLYEDNTSDLIALKRQREMKEKRRMERKQPAISEKEDRLKERADKERNAIERLKAMAEQSRAQGLGMMKNPDPRSGFGPA